MAESSCYSKFKEFILFQELFKFSISLYFILNEKYEILNNGEKKFLIPYRDFKKCLRVIRKAAAESCGIVCYKDEMCDGHKTLELMNDYENFMLDSVENKTLFYKYVEVEKFFDDDAPMMGYRLKPKVEVDLGWKSWSQRISYLN